MVASGVLVWLTASAFQVEEPAAKGREKPAELTPASLAVRPPGLLTRSVPNPFQPDAPAAGEALDAGASLASWLGEPGAALAALVAREQERAGWAATLCAAARAALVPGLTTLDGLRATSQGLSQLGLATAVPAPAFELQLQSIVTLADGRSLARISGRDLAPGDLIPGWDLLDPPRLLSVEGTSALIGHRGRQVRLDLDRRPVAGFGSLADG